MRMNEAYEQEVERTYGGVESLEETLAVAALGLAGEVGEVADIVKKWLFHEHPLDVLHLADELGDVLWYVTLAATAIGYSLDNIMERNVEKLRRRYPDGFDVARSLNRSEFEG